MGFAFWRQDEVAVAASYSLFGKLPQRADFVRVNATAPVAREYDQRLAEAIVALAEDAGWESAYDATAATLFAYRSRDRHGWFIGGQCPSHDQEYRRFPLVAGISRSSADIGNALPLLPLAYEVFYSGVRGHLENAIANSVDAVSCRGFLEGFIGTEARTGTDFELALALMHQFTAEHDSRHLQSILRAAYPHAELEQALLNIAFYANFVRHYPHSVTAQELVLPLPNQAGTAALVASAWLLLVGNLIGNPQRIAGFFFRDDFIVIAVDMFSDHFSPLLPLTHSVKVRGLMLTAEHETWSAHPLYPEIRYALTSLIAEPGASLQSVFDCAQQIGYRLISSE
jgi:type VI secretion system protein ImpM